MNCKESAEQCFSLHTKPLIKIELIPKKYLLHSPSQQRKNLVEKYLQYLENGLRSTRVERRCARAQFEWIPDKLVGKANTITRTIANYGFQNKEGKFLHPEEILYLLECNKLEIQYKKLPWSIEESYRNILNETKITLHNYLPYKSLLLQGYKTVPNEFNTKITKRTNANIIEKDVPPEKMTKNHSHNISDIFRKIRKKSPQCYQPPNDNRIDPHFTFQLHSSSLSLYISKANSFNDLKFSQQNNDQCIYALGPDIFVGFYQIHSSNLPNSDF